MGKLRVMTAIFGLLLGLSGMAHAALTSYALTGDVKLIKDFNGVPTIGTGTGNFSGTVIGDPTTHIVTGISLNFDNQLILNYDQQTLNGFTTKRFSDTQQNGFNLLYSSPLDSIFISPFLAVGAKLEAGSLSGSGIACITSIIPTHTPIPSAAWLFASGLLGLIGLKRKKMTLG